LAQISYDAQVEILATFRSNQTVMKNQLPHLILLICCISLTSCKDDEPETKPSETPTVVTTLAGGAQGLKDGMGMDAQFNSPSKIALSSSGEIYVIDQEGRALRKINSSGTVSTVIASHPKKMVALVFAKDGTLFLAGESWIGKLKENGSVEVLADGAQMPSESYFSEVTSMAMLPDGSLILFDVSNYRILNISTTGEVIAVLCSHPMGYPGGDRNGKLENIYFREVYDMYVTETGVIYFTDWLRHDLRKISIDKMVTTIAGLDYASPFSFPVSVARSKDGILFLLEGDRILKVDESGNFKTFAGGIPGYQDAIGASAKFFSPFDLVLTQDEHTMYVTDYNNHRIRKITF
jgi:DNA-binding beta-propeller fold protein YncE